MTEYKVVTLRGPTDDGWASDLNVLAKEGWRALLVLEQGGWPKLLMVRDIDPAREPSR